MICKRERAGMFVCLKAREVIDRILFRRRVGWRGEWAGERSKAFLDCNIEDKGLDRPGQQSSCSKTSF